MFSPAFPPFANMDSTLAANPLVIQARLLVLSCRVGLRCQAELLGFLQHRTKLFDTCLGDLVESIELNDAFDVLADHVQNTLADYSRECAKIAAIASGRESEAARMAGKLADEVIGEMGARTIS